MTAEQTSDSFISYIIEQEEVYPVTNNGHEELNSTIKIFDEWMKLYLKGDQYNSTILYFYLFPVGSITYHKSYPDHSKDFLICFPSIIKLNEIHDSLVPYLNESGKFKCVTILTTKLVPVLQLNKFNSIFEIIICFLPCQCCLTKKPLFDIRNPSQTILEQMDLKSIIALNSLRNCILIRDYLGNLFPIYQETLFQLKKWAIFKLIYQKSTSNYLNGTALSIMLADTFRKNIPTLNVAENLYIFFRHFLKQTLSKQVISINIPNFVDNMHKIVIQNLSFMRPKTTTLAVLTPAMPHQNCTRRVNQLSLDRIVDQFKQAFLFLESNSWNSCDLHTLMQPLTLIDFITYIKSVSGTSLQIILISIREDVELINREKFDEFEDYIKSKIKFISNRNSIMYYPLPIRNVLHHSKLRIRHFLVFVCSEIINSCSFVVDDNEIPRGIRCDFELIQHNDLRINCWNFDHLEKTVRLIYSDNVGIVNVLSSSNSIT